MKIISTILKEMEETYILGGLPTIFFLMILLMSVISFIISKFNFTSAIEKKEARYIRRMSNVDVYNATEGMNYSIFSSMLSATIILLALNSKFVYIIPVILKNMDIFISVSLGLTTIVMTVTSILIVWNKEYYLVFSIRDILRVNNFFKYLRILIFCCIFMCLLSLYLSIITLDTLFEILAFIFWELTFIYNIFFIIKECNIFFKTIFSSGENELNVLTKLYRIFLLQDVDRLNTKPINEWTKDEININVRYLLDKYLDSCKSVNVDKFEEMEFVYLFGIYKNKWYKKARKIYVVIAVCLLIISLLIDCSVLKKIDTLIVKANIVSSICTIMFVFVIQTENIKETIINIFEGEKGYFIKKKKNIFVTTVSMKLTGKKYEKYIHDMNSIVAFLFIELEKEDSKEKKVEDRVVEQSIKLIKDEMREEDYKFWTYLPLFSIGFFAYEKGIKIEEIKGLYIELKLKDEENAKFQRLIRSHIVDLTRYQNKNRHKKEINILSYFQWLNSNE